MAEELTELEICGRIIRLGDYVKVEYTSGKRFKGGQIKGCVTRLYSLMHGDNRKQAQLESGWCFHEGDKIIEHREALKQGNEAIAETKKEG